MRGMGMVWDVLVLSMCVLFLVGSVMRSVVVQPAWVVHERARQEVFHGFIDRVEIGENRLDSFSHQMLLCSHPHPACDEDGNTGQWRGHSSMLVAMIVASPVTVVSVGPLSPCVMASFVHPVPVDDFPFLEADDLIMESPPEMGADRDAVVGDECEYAVFIIHLWCLSVTWLRTGQQDNQADDEAKGEIERLQH